MLLKNEKIMLRKYRESWDSFAYKNALWAVLTEHKTYRITEFFKSGQIEIDNILEFLKNLGLTYQKDRALDFGCGVGRLTRAMSKYFKEVIGVDISQKMISLAKAHNLKCKNCRFVLNEKDDLSLFKSNSFSFIYCVRTF